MTEDTSLPRQTRAFIVLLALLQGALMYLAEQGHDHGWWPFAELGGRVCWYTLVLTVPTAMTLSVVRLRDGRFWQHAAGLLVLFLGLAGWAGWNATGAPGLRSSAVLAPFGASTAVALFVLLPWLQARLANGHWRAAYPQLFEHAWQNALTLALAALFTGICWLVLQLWASLFALVDIDFFRELFREEAFVYLATGTMAGLGILIGRTQQRPVQMARHILFAIFSGLLPLLAFIAVLFVVALPFTGLQPLWQTRSAASLLVAVIALLVLFLNAVHQDGDAQPPYPRWLRRVVEAGVLSLPLYALLALYALWLRIDQYGWTPDRFWAALLAGTAATYAFGYAWAVLRPRSGWLAPLRGINMRLSWLVIGLALLANTPVLDPYRTSVSSQLARLDNGRTPPGDLDLAYLRFDTGRRGYLAAVSLREHPAIAGDARHLAELERLLKRTQRWGNRDDAQDRLRDVDAIRRHVRLATAAITPGDDWWQALAGDSLHDNGCLQASNECVLLTPDLDGDGTREALLCNLGNDWGAPCSLSTRRDGSWAHAGNVRFHPHGAAFGQDALREALHEGRIQPAPRNWPDLMIEGAPGEPARVEDVAPPASRRIDSAATTPGAP